MKHVGGLINFVMTEDDGRANSLLGENEDDARLQFQQGYLTVTVNA